MRNSPRFFAVILILLLLLPPLFINQQQQQQENNDYFGMINDYLNTSDSPSSEIMEWLQSILPEENFLPSYLEPNEEENYATMAAGWDSLERPAQDEDPDGLSDSLETEVFRTDLLNSDSDNDGCTDELEVQLGFDPHAPDDPLFTLTAIARSSYRPDYLYALQDELAKFGIALDIELLGSSSFVQKLLVSRNYDICHISVSAGLDDPGPFTEIFYHSNGSVNLFMLEDSLNDWYIEQGMTIMPPDSAGRIQHYWDWEQYLMDEILPLVPAFTFPNFYAAYWSTLAGYNHSDGLLQSWGKMEWTAAHSGQYSTDELVIASLFDWINLSPLFQEDSPSIFITNAIMEPLVWFDRDMRAWPHLATSWTHLNDTYVRLSLREDVQWQTDPDGLFPNEEFDAEDVYFTLYCFTGGFDEHQELCDRWASYDCFEDVQIVDKYTVDVFIDGNSSTLENEPYAPYLDMLNTFRVLPEHYLNQSQLADGKTPDISHSSWNTFSSRCFGTGILAFDTYTAGVETNLTRFNDCWWMNSSITSDPALDWQNRFGDKWALEQLRIMVIDLMDVYTIYNEFELGHLDLIDNVNPTEREEYRADPNFDVQGKLGSAFGFFGFNLQESRGTPLQSSDACPGDPSMTIGLAVRKAIAHAADREGMNDDIHGGEYNITDYPLPLRYGIWLNPNIIRYDFDLDTAVAYLNTAGFSVELDSDADGLSDNDEITIYNTDPYDPDTDDDGLLDGEEVDNHSTDPLDPDSDDDGLNDQEEVTAGSDGYLTDPMDDDSDDDGLSDGDEVNTHSTDPLDDDTDDDLLTDGEEVTTYGTDPTDADSDDDNYLDGEEVAAGTDPNDPKDHPRPWLWPVISVAIIVIVLLIISPLVLLGRRKFLQRRRAKILEEVEVLLQKGQQILENGNLEEALHQFIEALKLEPDHPEANRFHNLAKEELKSLRIEQINLLFEKGERLLREADFATVEQQLAEEENIDLSKSSNQIIHSQKPPRKNRMFEEKKQEGKRKKEEEEAGEAEEARSHLEEQEEASNES